MWKTIEPQTINYKKTKLNDVKIVLIIRFRFLRMQSQVYGVFQLVDNAYEVDCNNLPSVTKLIHHNNWISV